MKRKVVISVCSVATVAILLAGYLFISNKSGNNPASNIHPMKVNLSEMRFTQEQLINTSDLIVKCEFNEKITKDRKIDIKNEDGSVNTVTEPKTTYKMKVLETLKGSADKYVEVATFLGGNEYLETGDEYVLFLDYKEQYDIYILVSYAQGLNIVKYEKSNSKSIKKSNSENETISSDTSLLADEPVEIQSDETEEVMDYKQLKDKIKSLDKK